MVIAENGDEANWFVTVSVDFGISFLFDGVAVFLSHGLVDDTVDALGNGLPVIFATTSTSPDTNIVFAASARADVAGFTLDDGIVPMLGFLGESASTYGAGDLAEVTEYTDTTVDPAINAVTDVFDEAAGSVFDLTDSVYGSQAGGYLPGKLQTGPFR